MTHRISPNTAYSIQYTVEYTNHAALGGGEIGRRECKQRRVHDSTYALADVVPFQNGFTGPISRIGEPYSSTHTPWADQLPPRID